MEVTAEPDGVTLDGEKEHWSPAGAPVQLKVTAWANPFCGVTVRVKFADCEAVTVALVGDADRVKVGGGRFIV